MDDNTEIRDLLIEIRNNQQSSLKLHEEHLAIAKEQNERSRSQIKESIDLQQQAIDRTNLMFRVGVIGIVICLALVLYLLVRYF